MRGGGLTRALRIARLVANGGLETHPTFAFAPQKSGEVTRFLSPALLNAHLVVPRFCISFVSETRQDET